MPKITQLGVSEPGFRFRWVCSQKLSTVHLWRPSPCLIVIHRHRGKKCHPRRNFDSGLRWRPQPFCGVAVGLPPPLPPGPVPVCLPLVSHSAPRPKPALPMALAPEQVTLSPLALAALGQPTERSWRLAWARLLKETCCLLGWKPSGSTILLPLVLGEGKGLLTD